MYVNKGKCKDFYFTTLAAIRDPGSPGSLAAISVKACMLAVDLSVLTPATHIFTAR